MYKEAKKSINRLNKLSLEIKDEKQKLYELVETTIKELDEFVETCIQPNYNTLFQVTGNFYKQDELIELRVLSGISRANMFYLMSNFDSFVINLSEELSIDAQFTILKFLGYNPKELKMSKRSKDNANFR